MTLTHDVCILFFVPIEIGNALTHGLVQPLTTSLTLALGGNTTAIDDFPAHLADVASATSFVRVRFQYDFFESLYHISVTRLPRNRQCDLVMAGESD